MLFAEGRNWIFQRLKDLETRLDMMRLPSIGLPASAAAAVQPGALRAMEHGALKVVDMLTESIKHLEQSVESPKALTDGLLKKLNKRLTFLQLQTDGLFQSVDLFMDALSTRADTETGLLLAGVDQIIAQALNRKVSGYKPPRVVTYLDSATRGGAITRARTKLPGGVVLPVAMVRVSPETLPTRLTSSLHEAGHQLSADLNIMNEAESVITQTAFATLQNKDNAQLWGSWTGELLADIWAYGLGAGAPAIDGLQRVLSLPAPLLYAIRKNDPHPPGAVRVPFAFACTQLLHPDPLLEKLAQRYIDIYADNSIPAAVRQAIEQLASAAEPVARALLTHPFKVLANKTLYDICQVETIQPKYIHQALQQKNALAVENLLSHSPLKALAIIGYARLLGEITAKQHDELSRNWLKTIARSKFLVNTG